MEQIPVVILCGGQGTRMRGSTLTKKELVEIGGRPIIWHVMRIFSAYGYNRFILTLGYQADQLKQYFLAYEAMQRDFTVQLGGPGNHGGEPQIQYHGEPEHPNWQVSLVDTGLHTEKASRIARVANLLTADRFFVTYGDGVGNIDLPALVDFHRQHGKMATITGVHVPFQYGTLQVDEAQQVLRYEQKPVLPYWINAGFMLFDRPVLDLMRTGRDVHLEREVLPQLAAQGELMLYPHDGFWRCVDTLKDTQVLEELWQQSAPWLVW